MFTIDELSIISIYKGSNVNKTIDTMIDSLAFVDDEDVKSVIESTVQKLKNLSNDKFLKLDLENTLVEEPEL